MKTMEDRHFAILRRHMIEVIEIHTDLMRDEIGKDKLDERVLTAMRRVPRHVFVPQQLTTLAYHDTPLPIGFDKTISQPFICALMTDLLGPGPEDVVLEIGTGRGYQTAILAELAGRVWSVEIVEELGADAEAILGRLGHTNIGLRIGDGSRGWAEHAPYDRIMVTAAATTPPPALIAQLKPGGRMVMPIGPEDGQDLVVIDKSASGAIRTQSVIPVRFSRLETVL